MLKYNQQGFMLLSTVLLLSAVVLIVVTSVSLLGIGEMQGSLGLFKGESRLTLVEGCTEDYLLKIRSNSSFVGGNITRPEGTCTIVITSGNPNWNITVSSLNTDYKRSIQVIFTKSSTGITLTSWKEI